MNLFYSRIVNFRGSRVFDLSPYTEIENSENSEIFSRLVKLSKIVLFEEVGISEVSQFSVLALVLKWKTQKTQKFCQKF